MLIKVGPRGQITIPKSLRVSLNIQSGDTIAIVQENEMLKLYPVKETIFDLVGSIPVPPEGPYSIEELHEAMVEHVVDRVMGKTDES